ESAYLDFLLLTRARFGDRGMPQAVAVARRRLIGSLRPGAADSPAERHLPVPAFTISPCLSLSGRLSDQRDDLAGRGAARRGIDTPFCRGTLVQVRRGLAIPFRGLARA